MNDNDDIQEIKKLYQLIALHELPLLKWVHRRVKYLTVLTGLLLLLIIILLVLSTVSLGIMIRG